MVPIQPTFNLKYFNFFKNNIENNFHESFFLSWEDALWHLLHIHKIKKDEYVLVPSFFCWDVVKNMNDHGLKHLVYEVDKFMQPDTEDFVNKIKRFKPKVVVIFHSVGMKNPLFDMKKVWLKYIDNESILIEDCVHKVLNPNKIIFISKNHYLIDSLRKVVPIQGSRLFSNHKITRVTLDKVIKTFWYRNSIIFWWILMQLSLVTLSLTKKITIQKYVNLFSEYAMKKGYDIIGDHKLSSVGSPIMKYLSTHINYNSIYRSKEFQVRIYLEFFKKKIINNSNFFLFPVDEKDYKQLRGYPIGIELNYSDQFLSKIRSKGLLFRFELNDSLWSKKFKVIYLPMGPHLSNEQIYTVCDKINMAIR